MENKERGRGGGLCFCMENKERGAGGLCFCMATKKGGGGVLCFCMENKKRGAGGHAPMKYHTFILLFGVKYSCMYRSITVM